MTTLKYKKVVSIIEEIFEMAASIDVVKKAISVSMADIDPKSRRFINTALDAQLSLLRAKEVIRATVENGELTMADADSVKSGE